MCGGYHIKATKQAADWAHSIVPAVLMSRFWWNVMERSKRGWMPLFRCCLLYAGDVSYKGSCGSRF